MCKKRKRRKQVSEVSQDFQPVPAQPAQPQTYQNWLDSIQCKENSPPWIVDLNICGATIPFKIDTGADISVITKKMMDKVPMKPKIMVRNYFSLKSRTLSSLLSNVVYKFHCLCDTDQVYIGKTKRHLTARVREHGNSRSAIFDHLQLCSRCKDNFSCNRFKILDCGRDDFETTIKEALYIKNSRPKLNKQLYTQGSSFILSVF